MNPEEDQRIHVISYAGYRGEEAPRRFLLLGLEIRVVDILERWVAEDLPDRGVKRYFRVRGAEGKTYRLYYHEEKMEWFCGE